MFDWLMNWRDFMPHGSCMLWRPDVVGLHLISDILIVLAYMSIPVGLVYISSIRRLPLTGIVRWFAAFIVLCGLTHAMEIYTLWKPYYVVEGIIKLACAVVSVVTVFKLVKLIPVIMTVDTPQEAIQKLLIEKKADAAYKLLSELTPKDLSKIKEKYEDLE